MRTIYSLLFFALCLLPLGAQTPDLIRDIAPGTEESKPARFTPFGDQVIFRADSAEIGVELWISDGTPEGTRLVKDLNDDPTVSRGNGSPDFFTPYQGKLYFRARAGALGTELWVTDGTTDGTLLLKDIQENDGNGAPFDFIVYDDLLYFTATTANESSELWVTDGTPDGTRLAVDINPAGTANPNFKTIFQDKLFFTASDTTRGNELFMSDGTPGGTRLVKDIRPGGNGNPSQYFEHKGELYFRANDGVHGTELWKTDGTTEGTVRVRDIREGSGSSSPSDFFTVGDSLFFVANDGDGKELWVTGGDSLSTRKYLDLNGDNAGNPRDIVEVVEGLSYYFVADTSDADDGAVFYNLTALGGNIGLRALGEILLEIDGQDPDDVIFTGTTLYFTYASAATGTEIAAHNLLLGTTGALDEIAPGAESSEANELTLVGNRVFLEAETSETGAELYGFMAQTARVSFELADGTPLLNGDTIDVGPVTPGFSVATDLTAVNAGTDVSLFLSNTLNDLEDPFSGDPLQLSTVSPGDNVIPDLITFSPGAPGTYLDTLTLGVQSLGRSVYTFLVRGTTVLPDLSVSADMTALAVDDVLDFGDVPTNRDSTIAVTLTNDGPGLLVLDTVRLNGGADFSTTTLTDTIVSGGSAILMVTFSPTETGEFRDTLTVVSSDGDGDFTISLTGTAIVNSLREQGLPARAVYPNPVTDRLTVELAQPLRNGQWRLFSATGRLLRRGVWPQGQRFHYLPVGDLGTGSYHLEVSSGANRVVAKIIKR